ncbi:hypothetical protein LR48_Vigan04g098900 [Vigna angularis]|uniref:DUF632 domain-containing protein n=1 Tax=Phaseolus angularis TaxID=3914 RepID=A0A0L9UDJ7_PHAAN|nr:hypothetical protein LR48_Vigan04g098900 [Vigna angularis]
MEGRDNSWERRINKQKRELAEWRRNMQEMRQETRELLRVLGGRVWNQEKGLEGSPGFVDEDQHTVNENQRRRRECSGEERERRQRGEKLNALEGRMEERMATMESSMDGRKAEMESSREEMKVKTAAVQQDSAATRQDKNPCRSGVAERSEAIEDKSSWGRTNGRSRVAERSVGSEQEKIVGPNGTGLTKPNGLALQAANPRGLKEPNGPETNGKELPNPNVKGQEEPNDLTFTVKGRTSKQSLSNWPNGLTIRMKAKEGKVDGRINGRERRMDFVKRWTSEQKKGLAVREAPPEGRELFEALKDIEDHFFRDYNSGKEVTRMLEANKIQEEWKSLEEELPPPKPPDLSWRAVARGFH